VRKVPRWADVANVPPDARASSGHSSWCRACHREAVRAWRRRNRDLENARRRAAASGLSRHGKAA